MFRAEQIRESSSFYLTVFLTFLIRFLSVFRTKHNKLRRGLHSPEWVFELDFYFPRVCPQAVSEQQPAVIGFPHYLNSSSIFDLSAISKPIHHQRLLRRKGHLESSVLAQSYDHRFGELVQVVWVKFRYICVKHSLNQFDIHCCVNILYSSTIEGSKLYLQQ